MYSNAGLEEALMSLLRESEGSTNIARPKPSHRISAAAQNSTQVRRGSKNGREFDPHAFLATIGEGRKAMLFPKKQTIFAQGDRADAVFYLQTGKVKLTVVSKTGKEATIGILSDRSFFGEGLATLCSSHVRSPILPTLPDFGHGTRLAASLNGEKKGFSFSPRWSEDEARRM
jgi:hypothetical protein